MFYVSLNKEQIFYFVVGYFAYHCKDKGIAFLSSEVEASALKITEALAFPSINTKELTSLEKSCALALCSYKLSFEESTLWPFPPPVPVT